MIRHLTTLALCGVLGSLVLAGNAEACHKKSCGHARTTCAPAPAPAPAPVAYAAPCAPKVKHCGFKLPSFGHKKAACAPTPAPCATAPASYAYAAPATYAAPGYPTATPQASMQH